MLFTFLRAFLILTVPVFMFSLMYVYRLKLTKNIFLLFVLLFVSLIINLIFNELYIVNNIFSILLLYLSVIVLLLKPKRQYVSIEMWMNISSKVLILVNLTGFINFAYVYLTGNGLIDDGFNGLYGRSGLSMHTFSLVNFIYCIYYFTKAKYKRAVFFFFSGFMCFYGLGLLLFIGSIAIVFLVNLKAKYIRYIVITPLFAWFIIVISTKINPHVFSYMNNNIQRVKRTITDKRPYPNELRDVNDFKTVKTPRKIMAFEGGIRVMSNPLIFLFGTSPGTYNSRASFLLNGEYTRNKLFKKINNRPFYANRDIYPLWNKNITYQYNDGTRNEPFSSILALSVEYGVLQILLISFLFWNSYRRLKTENGDHKFFIQSLFYFLLLNLLTENYLEYPEFILLIIIIYKSIESNNVKRTEG